MHSLGSPAQKRNFFINGYTDDDTLGRNDDNMLTCRNKLGCDNSARFLSNLMTNYPLATSRLKRIGAYTATLTVAVLRNRKQMGIGPEVSDEEFLLRYALHDDEVNAMLAAGPIKTSYP